VYNKHVSKDLHHNLDDITEMDFKQQAASFICTDVKMVI